MITTPEGIDIKECYKPTDDEFIKVCINVYMKISWYNKIVLISQVTCTRVFKIHFKMHHLPMSGF